MLTDNPILLQAAMRNYGNFPVPTRLIESRKTSRRYTAHDLAQLDIVTSVNKIGEIINASQELNTRMWDLYNNGSTLEQIMPLYLDVAMLDVLSNLEIDSAKREYPINRVAELNRLKRKHHRTDKHGKKIMPGFFAPVSRSKGYYDSDTRTYISHDTTMDYVQKSIASCRKTWEQQKFIPFVDVLNPSYCDASKANYDQIYRVLDLVKATQDEVRSIWAPDVDCDQQFKHILACEAKQRCIDYIDKIKFSGPTMYMLLSMIEDDKCRNISRMLFSILFGAPNVSFFDVVDGSRQPRDVLVEDGQGVIQIYNYKFSKYKMPQTVT